MPRCLSLLILILLATSPPARADEQPRLDAARLATGQVVELGELRLRVLEADVLPRLDNAMTRRHRFDHHGNPKLERLREQENLDDLVVGLDGEFQQQLAILAWAQARLPRFGRPTSDVRGALDIIAAADDGHTFYCSYYMDVFVSAAASMGWVTRSLALRVGNNWQGTGSYEHSAVEIWSNEHRKWVMLDPTYALHIEKEGVPLSAWEFRQQWFYGDRHELVFVIGALDGRRARYSDLPVAIADHPGYGTLAVRDLTLDKYAFVGYVPNNDFMDTGPNWDEFFISTDEQLSQGVRWHRGNDNPDDPMQPYFPLNQAALSLEHADDTHVRVHVDTLTPNFDRFEARFDSEQWNEVGESFVWALEPGANRVEVRSFNRFGVPGPVSRLVMRLEP